MAPAVTVLLEALAAWERLEAFSDGLAVLVLVCVHSPAPCHKAIRVAPSDPTTVIANGGTNNDCSSKRFHGQVQEHR